MDSYVDSWIMDYGWILLGLFHLSLLLFLNAALAKPSSQLLQHVLEVYTHKPQQDKAVVNEVRSLAHCPLFPLALLHRVHQLPCLFSHLGTHQVTVAEKFCSPAWLLLAPHRLLAAPNHVLKHSQRAERRIPAHANDGRSSVHVLGVRHGLYPLKPARRRPSVARWTHGITQVNERVGVAVHVNPLHVEVVPRGIPLTPQPFP
mmetsp:Transcript_8035/g.14953  ORF Transcript_8035/g.14953 Transcript_8035/m.14953 type:complete len:203 (+) Transcript_8035:9-617(+)